MLDDTPLLTVTDLKQYTFCPRVVYYEQCLPHIRPRTYKMDAGRDAHEVEQKRAVRRTLNRFGVDEGERYFDVAISDSVLGLTGIIDELIVSQTGEITLVDYKLAGKASRNHRLQLAAYALLAESHLNQSVEQGYIYLIPVREWVAIQLTSKLRNEVRTVLNTLRRMIRFEDMPKPVTQLEKCVACEFRRFCNDV